MTLMLTFCITIDVFKPVLFSMHIYFENKMTNYGPIGNIVTGLQYSHPGRARKIKADLFGTKMGHQSTNKSPATQERGLGKQFHFSDPGFFHL